MKDKLKRAITILFVAGVALSCSGTIALAIIAASRPVEAKPPRELERIADALERIADCHCVSICDKRHCEASSSSSNGGELP